MQVKKIGSQLKPLVTLALEKQRIPRTIHEGELKFAGQRFDWTEGFFPGTCWYMFELTGENIAEVLETTEYCWGRNRVVSFDQVIEILGPDTEFIFEEFARNY